jgi:hypothetical protein
MQLHDRPRVSLVRAPFTYRYNGLDVREEAILTALNGYLIASGAPPVAINDFHLQRDLKIADIINPDVDHYVVAVRETSDNIHYALRVAHALYERTDAKVWLYGQTSRLADVGFPNRIQVCPHNESILARHLGLSERQTFANGLRSRPYMPSIQLLPWQHRRVKGTVETTRGCHYPCQFCFINSGDNFGGSRWQTRSVEDIIHDLLRYRELGINNIVFHDSEFFGADSRDHVRRRELLSRISQDFPEVRLKLYSRADTIMKFGDFDLLRRAGVVSIFIGVESLYQPDLDSFNKKLRVETIMDCVHHLHRSGIFTDLSFILFNGNTTPASLRINLRQLADLCQSGGRQMGMPFFSFSFESAWSPQNTRALSDRTYVGWDVLMKSPAVSGAVFDPALEPLAEVYRLLAYEWSKKVVELNLARDEADAIESDQIEKWFEHLPPFCVQTMTHFLDVFDAGDLTLDSLHEAREELFRLIRKHHEVLPNCLRHVATYNEHAAQIDYDSIAPVVEGDEYWQDAIPSDGTFLAAIAQ